MTGTIRNATTASENRGKTRVHKVTSRQAAGYDGGKGKKWAGHKRAERKCDGEEAPPTQARWRGDLRELRDAVEEELKLHSGYAKKWGADAGISALDPNFIS